MRGDGVQRRLIVAGTAFLVVVLAPAWANGTPRYQVAGVDALVAETTPPAPVPAPPPLRHVRVVVAGDVLPHLRVVRQACRDPACNFARLLEPTKPLVSAADLAICHLEVPVAPPGTAISGYPTFGSPPSVVHALAATGWDRCSTASNHSIDRGTRGIDATLDELDRLGISHVGSARSPDEAAAIPFIDVQGVPIAHLAYTYGLNGLRLPKGQGWRVNLIDPARIRRESAAARTAGARIVIVSLHWGNEYQRAPTVAQRRLADDITRDGTVDLIVGHHAHVVQPIASVNGRWVLYGLGNHLSGQYAASGRRLGTQDGLIVEVTFDEQPDGTFTAARPVAHPTWVHPTTRQVFLTGPVLSDERTPASTRRLVGASAARTAAVVGGFLPAAV